MSPDANEWLTYKIPRTDLNDPTSGYAIVKDFTIQVFNPYLLGHGSKKYASRKIQIEIGNTPDNYHYQSRIFQVDQNND